MTTQEWTKVLEEELKNNFNSLQLNDHSDLVQALNYFILKLMYQSESLSIDSEKEIAYYNLIRKYIVRN